jgi:hypothetical protein
MFADCLEQDDISTLVRTTRALDQFLTPYLYRRAKDEESRDGRPFVLKTVDAGNLTAVRHFIEVGTSVHMSHTMKFNRPTALHSRMMDGNIGIARLLIQHDAKMSPVNGYGCPCTSRFLAGFPMKHL